MAVTRDLHEGRIIWTIDSAEDLLVLVERIHDDGCGGSSQIVAVFPTIARAIQYLTNNVHHPDSWELRHFRPFQYGDATRAYHWRYRDDVEHMSKPPLYPVEQYELHYTERVNDPVTNHPMRNEYILMLVPMDWSCI